MFSLPSADYRDYLGVIISPLTRVIGESSPGMVPMLLGDIRLLSSGRWYASHEEQGDTNQSDDSAHSHQ